MSNQHPDDGSQSFIFGGFDSPNTTPVPDAFFDVVAPKLTESELRVALYIIRRTFGFKKDSDTISLKQMAEGIVTRDGRILDHGTGLRKSSVANALQGLKKKGVILFQRNRSPERGDEPTTYALNIKHHALSIQTDAPVSTGTDRGLSMQTDTPVSTPVDTQETGVQETVDKKQIPPTPRSRGAMIAPSPIEGMATDPGVPPQSVVPPPPTPSQALVAAEARILDFPRRLDRQSRVVKNDMNGWADQPPERIEKIKAEVWDRWRAVNPERIAHKDLLLIPTAVAPDEVRRFQAQTLAYLDAVGEAKFLKGFRRWLEEWRDWTAPATEPKQLGPIAQVREMAEATRRINRKEATG